MDSEHSCKDCGSLKPGDLLKSLAPVPKELIARAAALGVVIRGA